MKRITKQMKRYELVAAIIETLFIAVVVFFAVQLFSLYDVPETYADIEAGIIEKTYYLYNNPITTSQINLVLTILLGFLVVAVPLTFTSFKRFFNKEDIELDQWQYRNQYLLSLFDLVTLNVPSAVIRFQLGQKISNTVVGFGFIQSAKSTFVNLGKSIKNVFKKKEHKELTQTQEDIEKLNRNEFILKVVRLVATYTFLTLVAIAIFIPFYWMMLTALKDYPAIKQYEQATFLLPHEMQWSNFKIALSRFDFGQYMWNTLWVGVTTMIGTVLTTILAAFAFSRLDFKGREFIFSILLMTMMIPGELYTITNLITVNRLGWFNSYLGLIIPFTTSVFYIFFLRQAFKQIPDTLYRAAKIDGCSDFKYLTRVMIPIAAPTIITIIILSTLGAWDAYIWPNLIIDEEHKHMWLISVALRREGFTYDVGDHTVTFTNLQLAATALVTVPLLIVFFTFKKFIVTGVGRSGTKG